MMQAVSRLAKGIVVVAGGALALFYAMILMLMAYGVLYLVFPTWVGPHRAFFKTCAAIPEGASIPEVLDRMHGYVFIRRSESRPVDDVLLASPPLPTLDDYGRGPSFLFYPSPRDTHDWCLVHFRRNQVVRSAGFPSHIGAHHLFFETCAAIPEGASISEVLERMRDSTFVRRFGKPRVTDALLASNPRPTPDRDGESSFLFYPNARDTADWCVVYFKQDQVVRTMIAPD